MVLFVFQSTHPHGVRQLFRFIIQFIISFNPRTHTGCDVRIVIDPIPSLCFNPRTHTGCDIVLLFYHNANISFNPRTHTGCDTGLRYSDVYNLRFQSTHPHGVRRLSSEVTGKDVSFNPRTHTGCDEIDFIFSTITRSFNPRTHTGCDLRPSPRTWMRKVSIHAPTRGATVCKVTYYKSIN